MPSVTVERTPVRIFGLGLFGFDHLQLVYRTGPGEAGDQSSWFVIEGLRDVDAHGVHLGVEGWDGGTTLADANGGAAGEALAHLIGLPGDRGAHLVAEGSHAFSLWAQLTSHAVDLKDQHFPYIALSLPDSLLPTINSSSLVVSLLHHAGVAFETVQPEGLRLSPGIGTLLGTSGPDRLEADGSFGTLMGGAGDDTLLGSDAPDQIDKLYGGAGNDTLRWSPGINVMHGGQPGMPYADDGIDTVDYAGAGQISIEAARPGEPHVDADFVVRHARGIDYLMSIEEIVWDAMRDEIALGEGVGLAPPHAPAEPAKDGEFAISAFDDDLFDGWIADGQPGFSGLEVFDFPEG